MYSPRTVMTRTWSQTTDDPLPIINEIDKQRKSFQKNIGKEASRIYLGETEMKALYKVQDIWKVAKGPEGEVYPFLLGLLCFKTQMPQHIHVSYNAKDCKVKLVEQNGKSV